MKAQLINLDPIKDQVKQKLIEQYEHTTYMNTDTVDLKLDIKEILKEYIDAQQIVEPTIYITAEAHLKMRTLVNDTATEIGWYGVVSEMPGLEKTYVIEDIIVYPQKVTGVTCEQDDDKMFEFEMSLSTDVVNHKRFHGHSHVNMGVFASSTDENFYQNILTQVNDYFIITITNKNGSYNTRFYDIAHNLLYTEVPIRILLEDGTTLDSWYDDVKTKLNDKPIVTTKYAPKPTGSKYYHTNDNYNKYRYDDDEDEFDDFPYWDSRFGYITKEEKEDLYRAAKKAKRGR